MSAFHFRHLVFPVVLVWIAWSGAGCAGRATGQPPVKDERVITAGGGGCLHHSRTACVEYSSDFKPGEARRQCLNRDVETFLPAGCPAENRRGRCLVRRDMLIVFYDKISAAGAARICRNSFNGRWVTEN